MEDFEKRVAQYIERAEENVELVRTIIESEEGERKARLGNIMLRPSNELELRTANALLNLSVDCAELCLDLSLGAVKQIPEEDNVAIPWIVEIISDSKGDKSTEELVAKYTNELSPELSAKIIYQLLVSFVGFEDESKEKLGKLLGYDLNNELDNLKLELDLENAKSVSGSLKTSNAYLVNEESTGEIESMASSFHTLLENGKVLVNEELSSELTNTLPFSSNV